MMKAGSIGLMKWQRAARAASSEMRDIEFKSADHVRRHTRFRNSQPHSRPCSPAPRSALLTLFQALRYDRQAPKRRRLTRVPCLKTESGEARKAR